MFFTPTPPTGTGLPSPIGPATAAAASPAPKASPMFLLPKKTSLIAVEFYAAALGGLFPLGITFVRGILK